MFNNVWPYLKEAKMDKQQKENIYKNIGFCISITFIFGITLLLMLMIKARWYGFFILAATVALLCYLRSKNKLDKWKIRLCWFGAICMAIATLFISKPYENISLVGTIVSEGIGMVTKLPAYSENFLKEEKSTWEAPDGYELEKHKLSASVIELLKTDKNQEKVIYQLHGGSYLKKLRDIYRYKAVVLSEKSNGAYVASLDYRVAPEYTFPAALEDALEGWNYLLDLGYKPENIIIEGDSAGGNLALALSLKLRDNGMEMPAGIICISPWADLTEKGDSHQYNLYLDSSFGIEEGDKKSKPAVPLTYAGDTDLRNSYLSPVYGNYDKFPPMLILVGSYEVLESDSITIYKKAIDAGVDAKLIDQYGMFHVYPFMYNLTPESRSAWKEIEKFMIEFLRT